ncbi:hypothetical protein AYO20_09197 [Fonsecaea nubica]|uniref:TauD/TfdA-like domain-containing protein n=1 Tax=Fonsecaea nubica TaxID=856822 RepID=A0A178CHL6_9EURO|nr:hypothetical protein AYO20_09197 [Fonsecaea nubica]OAL29460.1 hypothetical protein AYO20_09197 [Fonsecaea nubica]
MSASAQQLHFEPLHPRFVAEVHGMDWSKPIPDETIEQLKKGIAKYGVLVFRKANLDNEAHIAFSRRFGNLDSMPLVHGRGRGRFPHLPALFDISNLDEKGEVVQTTNRVAALMSKGNELWHADMQYHPHRDKYSFLRAVEIPPPGCGGETEFADSRTAYETLSPAMKDKIDHLVADCSLIHNRRLAAPELYRDVDPYDWSVSRWKAVYPHEDSGRMNLYVTSYAYRFDGYTIAETQKLVQELITHGTQPDNVFKVKWEQNGDLVMWDNTAVWHRALDDSQYKYKYKRDMRRTNTYDDGPYAFGENDPANDWKVNVPLDPFEAEKKQKLQTADQGGAVASAVQEVSAAA